MAKKCNKCKCKKDKIELPSYYDYSKLKDKTANDIKEIFAVHHGIKGLAKVRKKKDFKNVLESLFLCEYGPAVEINIEGLGNYVASVVDVTVTKDEDGKTYRPVVEICVNSDYDGCDIDLSKDLNHTTRVYYDLCYGNTVIEAVDSIVSAVYQDVNNAFCEDYNMLPEEMKGCDGDD